MSEYPGTYRLRNAQSGTFMTMDIKQGQPILDYQAGEKDKKSMWQIVPVSTGGYKLKNIEYGLEVHMDGASGGKLFGAPSGTVWSIRKTLTNELEIQAYVRNTYVVELDQGNRMTELSPKEETKPPPNVKTGTVIDLQRGAAGQGVNIFGYEPNNGPNQKWDIQGSGNGSNMTIRSVATAIYATYPSFEQGAILKSSAQPHEYVVTAVDKGF
ncbi:hypothetical protein FRC08_006506 [Ceratobasidium sp. 394]|nr:hypothetical protein FRC08_006506 [Ceratobasidium sp. 394]